MPPLHHETNHEVLARPDTISVTFITKEGKSINVKGREGERLMYLAHRKGRVIQNGRRFSVEYGMKRVLKKFMAHQGRRKVSNNVG